MKNIYISTLFKKKNLLNRNKYKIKPEQIGYKKGECLKIGVIIIIVTILFYFFDN